MNQGVWGAYALDCRIRSAIEAFDFLDNWLEGSGTSVSKTARDKYAKSHGAPQCQHSHCY
eukprot:7435445-Pyramimonas_sp.AAC.1